jgi:hypothetical protein
MEKFLNAIQQAEDYMREDNRILGVSHNARDNRIEVQVARNHFKDVVESFNIQPCYVEEKPSGDAHIELWTEIHEVVVCCVVTDHEYEMDFREWHTEEPNIDEEFLVETSPMPENERLMKIAGHKLHDFM